MCLALADEEEVYDDDSGESITTTQPIANTPASSAAGETVMF